MQTIEIVFFLLKTRITKAFKAKAHQASSIAWFLFLIYLFFVGWSIPVYLNEFNRAGLAISHIDFLKAVAIFTLSSTIFKEFIPGYIPKKRVLPEYHPLNDAKRIFISAVFNLLTKGNVAIQCLVIAIALADPEITFPHFLFIELCFLIGFFISGNMKTLLEQGHSKRGLYLSINVAAYPFLLIAIWSLFRENISIILLFSFLMAVSLLFVYYDMERKAEQAVTGNRLWWQSKKLINYSSILAIILKTKKLAQVLTASLILKITVLLFVLFVEYHFDEERGIGEYFAIGIFLSPLMTFIFLNNVYGLNGNLWLNVELAGGSVRHHVSIFKKIFIYLIALDAMMTIPAIVIARYRLFETITFYLSCCIAFFFISFLLSSYCPRKLNKVFFNLKGPASLIAQIVAPILPVVFMLPIISSWFYLTNLLLILLLWLLYKLLLNDAFFDRSKQLLFIKLFKK